MKVFINEVTKAPNFELDAKLLQIGTSVRELKNDKKTQYRLATAEILEGPAKGKKVVAMLFESQVDNVQTGENYTVVAAQGEGRMLFTLKPFITGDVITDAAALGFAKAEVPEGYAFAN